MVDVVGGWVVVVGWLVKNIIKFPGIENNLPCFQELFIKNMWNFSSFKIKKKIQKVAMISDEEMKFKIVFVQKKQDDNQHLFFL